MESSVYRMGMLDLELRVVNVGVLKGVEVCFYEQQCMELRGYCVSIIVFEAAFCGYWSFRRSKC